jgi:signal transduction histidine kinase
VDKHAEACDACHSADEPLERLDIRDRTRIFRAQDGHRVLGTIEPIVNERSCSEGTCHAHSPDHALLGVLDVAMSLEDTDRRIRTSQIRLIALAAAAIAAGSALIWWLNRWLVLAPVGRLVAATRRVAGGDLSTRIPVGARHELGDLGHDFNEMVERLAQARAQVAQTDKLASVGRLAAGVAHEINNPLTGVLTYASFLLKRAGDQAELRKDLEVIVGETKRCRQIVRGLLDFARQSGSTRVACDLNLVAQRAAGIVGNQLALDRVRLDIELAPALPAVSADPNQIQQVLVNLLVNAKDAVGDEGRIRLSSRSIKLPAWGTVPVHHAQCSEGCELITPSPTGAPAIRVLRNCQGSEARLLVDARTGELQPIEGDRCPQASVASFACPRCHVSLESERVCAVCGSPAFSVAVPPGERAFWCSRNGCSWTAWASQDDAGNRPFVELCVEDNGHGIPPEHRSRLFEPFFTTKGTKGTGLGLSVSWGIVVDHGGIIEVASDEGLGSRFTVRLPAGPLE